MPDENDLLERAITIAVRAHRGQRDFSGEPYVMHPIRVMLRVETVQQRIVAILHDVVEDTDCTMEDLRRQGFPEKLLKALDCVTKREGEDYEDFVKRSASDPIARRVKIADLEDNMDVRRRLKVKEKDARKLAKYLKAWRELTA